MLENESHPSISRLALAVLSALVLVHILLASWYSSITPYRQAGYYRTGHSIIPDIGAPDERQHANYIRRFMTGQGFGVLDPKDPNLGENYQVHQPPAYYLLATGWAKLAQAEGVEAHDDGIKLRFLNALIGAGTVVGTFFLGFWGHRRIEVGLIAAAFVALLPMNIALSGAISNDPLLFLLCTWVLALLARSVREGWDWKGVIWIGVLTGLAMLTKTTALALVPVILVAAFLKRPTIAQFGAAAGIALVFAMPWWLRNMSLYGDPFALKQFNLAFAGSPQAQAQIDGLGLPTYLLSMVGWWTARSFIGAFGYMDIWLNETGSPMGAAPNALYRLLIAGMVLTFFAWIASATKPEWKEAKSVQIVNGLFLVVVILLFVRFNLQYFQAQARYVLPAISVIGCGVALGLLQLTKGRWLVALALVTLIFGGVATYAGTRLPDEFAKRIQPS